MSRGFLSAFILTTVLLFPVGCSQPESSGLAAPDSPAPISDVPITKVATDAEVTPLVERYLEAIGSSADDGDANEATVRLFRSAAEEESLREIRRVEPDARVAVLTQLVESAEQHPEVIRRVEDAAHAAVGLDLAMRAQVIEQVVQPGCQKEADSKPYQAAVRIGMFLRADEEVVPGFGEKALRVLLDTPEADRPDSVYSTLYRLDIYSEGLATVDPVERCRLWAAVLELQQLERTYLRPIDLRLLEQLSQVEAKQVGTDYGVLLRWFLRRPHKIVRARNNLSYGMAVDAEMEQELQCAKLFAALLKADPQPAVQCLSNDDMGRELGRMKRSFPELFAELPEAELRVLAQQEKEAFLAALQARRLYKANSEASSKGPQPSGPEADGPPDLPDLFLAGDYCSPKDRRELATAIAMEMKTCEKERLLGWVMHLTAVASALKPEECVAALEFLEPSPFGGEQEGLTVDPSVYRDFVAAMPTEAGDKVTRWLFERIRTSDRPAVQYPFALPECGGDCSGKTATIIVDYVSKNHGMVASGQLWASLAAIADAVPKADADPMAAKLMAEAQEHPDAITAVVLARLAGLLTNANSEDRYRAFELVLDKTDYHPEKSGGSRRTALVDNQCLPAMAAIAAGLDPEDKQKAFGKLMATLTGTSATPEAQVLAGGLAAVASDLSTADAERAFGLLVRLSVADRQSHPKMPGHVLAFLEARDREEWPGLIRQLLPRIVTGEVRDSGSSMSSPSALMRLVASELPSSEVHELLRVMYDSLPDIERVSLMELVAPLLDSIPSDNRDLIAQELLGRMQETDNPLHLATFTQSVARLGRDVSSETRMAMANKLLDDFQAAVKEAQAGNWRGPRPVGGRFFCDPLSELLPTLDPEDAAPLRDRLVKVLCQIVYQSDALPADPEVVRVYPNPQSLASEVAQVLGKTQATMSPEVMDTVLYCLVSFGRESHPVGLKKTCSSIQMCQGTASPGVGIALLEEISQDPLPRIMEGWDQIIMVTAPKIPEQDLPAFYAACWDAYARYTDPKQRRRSTEFSGCLIGMGRLLPADAAWSATQMVLKRWPDETNREQRKLLQRLYRALHPQLSDSKQQEADTQAESLGLELPPNPATSRRPPRANTPEVSIDDLDELQTRRQNLQLFLRSHRGLPLEESLALVEKLDAKGILTTRPQDRYQEAVLQWFVGGMSPEATESILPLLAQPDCVGFKQSLLATALAAHRAKRFSGGDLWDLADLLEVEK
ncbi:hypothetical protein [Aeoliella sp.]|uniref:hypothetical protein n=1 Tax=Aeoliella sp. TaxID=2795800 RepID=UPI003CCB9361